MQRFVNNPDYIVDDMLEGIVHAHDYLEFGSNNKHVIKYKHSPRQKKVGLVSGGGSGHEPAFLGYVGKNMLDAVAVGEVFSSPPASAFYDAFKEVDSGEGVVCLFGNYAGDNMNVKMAVQMAEDDDINVKYVVANDDISSAPVEEKERRHGIAGGVYMWKTAGALAGECAPMDEILRVAQKTVDNTRSICVGLSSCTIPAVGTPNFHIEEGTMEIGIGHHGEPGINVEKIKTAKEIAEELTQAILDDMPIHEGEEVSVLLSGLGSTPIMELYVLYDAVYKYLSNKGISVFFPLVGNYVTSLDMNGAALTILKLDEELKSLLTKTAKSVGIVVE